MNLNKAFVLGNVTRDPEARSMPNGNQVVNFGLATNRFYTDQQGQKQQDTEFHNVVAFGKLADTISRYVTKGTLILIEGRIKTRNWQDQQGAKHWKTEIIAENMQLGPRGVIGGSGQYNKSFSGQENQPPLGRSQTGEAKSEDIPIIEENTPPANFVNTEEPIGHSPTDEAKKDGGEIDISQIPF